jgi:hypothetical protein
MAKQAFLTTGLVCLFGLYNHAFRSKATQFRLGLPNCYFYTPCGIYTSIVAQRNGRVSSYFISL